MLLQILTGVRCVCARSTSRRSLSEEQPGEMYYWPDADYAGGICGEFPCAYTKISIHLQKQRVTIL